MATPVRLPPPPKSGNPEVDLWMIRLTQLVNVLGSSWSCVFTDGLTAGFSFQIPNEQGLCLLNPAGALTHGTLIMPKQAADGFEQKILSQYSVSTLTITPSPGQTIVGSTSFHLHEHSLASYRWEAETQTWYQMLAG